MNWRFSVLHASRFGKDRPQSFVSSGLPSPKTNIIFWIPWSDLTELLVAHIIIKNGLSLLRPRRSILIFFAHKSWTAFVFPLDPEGFSLDKMFDEKHIFLAIRWRFLKQLVNGLFCVSNPLSTGEGEDVCC